MNLNYDELRNYNTADGLQDSEFGDLSGCVLHDGEILFGGVSGFNAFYPDEITEYSTPPDIVFTKLEIENQEINVGTILSKKPILSKKINSTEELILGYKENSFTI